MLVFNNLSNIGDLYLKRVLFEFEGMPILFVCTRKDTEYFLCLCTDSIIEFKWLITQIKPSLLIELIEDKISVYEAFEKSNSEVAIVKREENGFSTKSYKFSDISEDELPDKEEKLENEYLGDFLEELRTREVVTFQIKFDALLSPESCYVAAFKEYTFHPVLSTIANNGGCNRPILKRMQFGTKFLEERLQKRLGLESITIDCNNIAIQDMKYNRNYSRPKCLAIRV